MADIRRPQATPPLQLNLMLVHYVILHSTDVIEPKCTGRQINKSEVPNGGNEHHGSGVSNKYLGKYPVAVSNYNKNLLQFGVFYGT